MMTVNVRPRAERDLLRNAGILARTVSAQSADRWLTRIRTAVLALAEDADRHPEADEATDLGLDLRCKLFDRRPHVYRILFTIDGKSVNVLRVRHAAEDQIRGDDL